MAVNGSVTMLTGPVYVRCWDGMDVRSVYSNGVISAYVDMPQPGQSLLLILHYENSIPSGDPGVCWFSVKWRDGALR